MPTIDQANQRAMVQGQIAELERRLALETGEAQKLRLRLSASEGRVAEYTAHLRNLRRGLAMLQGAATTKVTV
jgi:septal ring factor EnvC (AmiA/AmiB activator)